MSELEVKQPESLEQTKPQDVEEIEKALRDINSYKNAVGASTVPGAQVKAMSGLLEFLTQTFKQLETQYVNHPYVKDLIEKSKASQTSGKK